VDKTAARVSTDLKDEPEVEIELGLTLGQVYFDLEIYKEMAQISRETLRLARARVGQENLAVADELGQTRSRLILPLRNGRRGELLTPANRDAPVHGRDGNPQHLSCFLRGHSNEVAELDEFGFLFVLGGEFVQGLVDGQQFVVLRGGCNLNFLNVDPCLTAAVARCASAPCVFDQDPPHRLCRCAEEMRAPVPTLALVARQPQPRLMHQGGRLQSLSRILLRPMGFYRVRLSP
jgi:hypothetical protein